jgi:hypothetical protein
MLEWLAYQVPWWVWAVLAIVVIGFLHRFIGLRNALVAAGIAAAAIFHTRARQQGWKDREDRIEQDKAKAIVKRRESDAEIDQMDSAGRDAEWDRWLRDDKR